MTGESCFAVSLRRLGFPWRVTVAGRDSTEAEERIGLIFRDEPEITAIAELHPTKVHAAEGFAVASELRRAERIRHRTAVLADIARARAS